LEVDFPKRRSDSANGVRLSVLPPRLEWSPEEALAQALIAKRAWLEAAHAEGKPISAPRYRPVIYQIAPV